MVIGRTRLRGREANGRCVGRGNGRSPGTFSGGRGCSGKRRKGWLGACWEDCGRHTTELDDRDLREREAYEGRGQGADGLIFGQPCFRRAGHGWLARRRWPGDSLGVSGSSVAGRLGWSGESREPDAGRTSQPSPWLWPPFSVWLSTAPANCYTHVLRSGGSLRHSDGHSLQLSHRALKPPALRTASRSQPVDVVRSSHSKAYEQAAVARSASPDPTQFPGELPLGCPCT